MFFRDIQSVCYFYYYFSMLKAYDRQMDIANEIIKAETAEECEHTKIFIPLSNNDII